MTKSQLPPDNLADLENKKLPHAEIAAKWSAKWSEVKLDETDLKSGRKLYYNLMMFPYPSAEGLHVGNMYAFTGSDIFGRFMRMQGFNVFEPIGLDGFGIHSENYALKVGRHPVDHAGITRKNFYSQLRKIGAMFDWSRTVETYDPDYYRWTQWLFIEMFKHGLAYRAKAEVNWCLSCKTVLADEQVIPASAKASAGTCERCGNLVEKKLLEQWFFRITAYADKLLENLKELNWSSKVKIAQERWIGKSTGINIEYPVVDSDGKSVGSIKCFTTRPDTNFGATFIVIAPEHSFINQLPQVIKGKQLDLTTKYVMRAKARSVADRDAAGRAKTGVNTGLYCLNRLNDEKLPLYISDFVIISVGTGAVVGVPGHDKRDYEFAVAMNLPVRRVVVGPDGNTAAISGIEDVQEESGSMINSKFLNGLDIHTATVKMMDYLEEKSWGQRVNHYHLRDWLISRQRYWGPPIPMIYCQKCASNGQSWFNTSEAQSASGNLKLRFDTWDLGFPDNMSGWYPVPEDQLPVVLPRIEDYKPGDDGIAPLAKHKEFYEVTCPGCGSLARRETDVSDTFLDSSWYFLRYPSINKLDQFDKLVKLDKFHNLPWDPDITKKWLPVDMYTGGAEHSVLHLMYSRFVTMALHDWGYLDFTEPFTRFFAHGLVIKDGAKMSKSKGNVVNPDQYIVRYGADALRIYLMFMGPFSQGGDFRDSAMEGTSRWLGRVWRLVNQSLNQRSTVNSDKINRELQKLINKVTDDLTKRRCNTAIASMMEFTNFVSDTQESLSVDCVSKFVRLLAPFAPHVSEELWTILQNIKPDQFTAANSVHLQPWPQVNAEIPADEEIELVVQINGKLRGRLQVTSTQAQDKKTIIQLAAADAKIKSFMPQLIRQTIFVPGKLINFVG